MPTADATRTHVLVVEDDETIGRHLNAGLRSHGYTTAWARTGSSALAAVTQTATDVVLLDLGLPDLDGIDVARRLRTDHPGVLLIILTARDAEIDMIAGLDAGADDYLVKPFSLTVLLARLRAHLRRRPAEPQTREQPIRVADLTVDRAARRCLLADTEVPCGPRSSSCWPSSPGTPEPPCPENSSWPRCGTRTGSAPPRPST